MNITALLEELQAQRPSVWTDLDACSNDLRYS